MLSASPQFVTKGIVFDLHRFSIHDGPGIRTTVFLKGCPLSCVWCHNPESQSPKPEKMVRLSRCIQCGVCVGVCPQQGITVEDGIVLTDGAHCIACGACAAVCVAQAAEIVGWETNVADLLTVIQRDQIFYDESGGGVTFSGGEPMFQIEFLETLMSSVHAAGMHTALDTSGFASWESFLRVLPYSDLVLYDIKTVDEKKHKEYTGVSNRLILENLEKINNLQKPIWLRFPVIPGLNDDLAHLDALVKLIRSLSSIERVCLLPYHAAAAKKYEGLAMNYSLKNIQSPNETEINKLLNWLVQAGVPAVVGGG